jgi:hypothetical protein
MAAFRTNCQYSTPQNDPPPIYKAAKKVLTASTRPELFSEEREPAKLTSVSIPPLAVDLFRLVAAAWKWGSDRDSLSVVWEAVKFQKSR